VRRLTEDGALDASFGTAGDGSVHDLDGSLLTGNRTWKAIGGSRSNSACPGSAGWPRSHRSALPPPPLSTRHLETSRDGSLPMLTELSSKIRSPSTCSQAEGRRFESGIPLDSYGAFEGRTPP
jgi:hypothetical protein